jgi:hypothetical protein
VTIIKSGEGFLLSGYTPISWQSSPLSLLGGSLIDDSKESFVFTLTNPHNISPSKYPLNDPSCAFYYEPNYGPIFGIDDI